MRKLMDELKKKGMVYENLSSKWACAPLVVPKAGPAQWRFTVDLRPVNKFTILFAFQMPVVDEELPKLAKSKQYCNVNFTISYWQLLLHEDSREFQSWVTPDGIITPMRVPHGTTNAVLHLQSWMINTLPTDLRERVLLLVDYFLFHAETVKELLNKLEKFLNFFLMYHIKLHPLSACCSPKRPSGVAASSNRAVSASTHPTYRASCP